MPSIRTPFSAFSDWFARNPWAVLLLIFLTCVVVRGISLRFEGSFDPDAHFHARMADEIVRTHELVQWDSLSLGGRVYSYPPLLHILLAILSQFTGLPSMDVLKFLGIIVGSLLTVSTYLLAFHFSRSQSISLWSALFAGLSNIAVWRTAGFTRPDGIALTLIPFLLYLWLTRRERVALLASIAMVLLHTLSSFIYALLLSLWFALGLAKRVSFAPLLPVALVGMLVTVALWFFSIGLPLSDYASHLSLDSTELTKFMVLGFILFFPLSWIFSLVGIWKRGLPLLLAAWIGLTILIGAFGVRLAMYMIPFLAIAGGYGMQHIVNYLHGKRLTIPVVGVLVVILGCASLFFVMMGIGPYVAASEYPALSFLKAHSTPHDAVLTTWDAGHVMTYYTGLPVVIDGYFEFGHELTRRNEVMNIAHTTSNCSAFLNALDEFRAKFFFLAKSRLSSFQVENGVLQLERCPGVRIIYSGDGGRIYERAPFSRA